MTVRPLSRFVVFSAFFGPTAVAGPHGIDGPVEWRTDAVTAVAESRATGKPIVAMFTAEWCGFCKKMLRETYRDPVVADHVRDCFVPLVIDADEHKELAEDLGVTAFPTTLIFTPEGDLVGNFRGYKAADEFAEELGARCRQVGHVAAGELPVLR